MVNGYLGRVVMWPLCDRIYNYNVRNLFRTEYGEELPNVINCEHRAADGLPLLGPRVSLHTYDILAMHQGKSRARTW